MNNQLNTLFFNKNYITPFLHDKIFNSFFNLYYLRLKIYFLSKNDMNHRFLFLLKLMLLEKLTNNRVRFIYNLKLLKKKVLKVGGFLSVSKQKIYSFLLLFFYYSLPKIIYSLDLTQENHYCFYDTKYQVYSTTFFTFTKFLFVNYFSYNLDYYKYYNFFETMIYKLKIKVCTLFKHYLMNRDLFRLVGLNII